MSFGRYQLFPSTQGPIGPTQGTFDIRSKEQYSTKRVCGPLLPAPVVLVEQVLKILCHRLVYLFGSVVVPAMFGTPTVVKVNFGLVLCAGPVSHRRILQLGQMGAITIGVGRGSR